jgi:hypothetical protein
MTIIRTLFAALILTTALSGTASARFSETLCDQYRNGNITLHNPTVCDIRGPMFAKV